MNSQELYDYIDQRIDELTIEEKEWRNSYDFLQAGVCVSRKLELLDLKNFIQSKAMIRTTPTKRNDFKSQNMFKGIEVTPTRLYRKDNYTLWIVLLTIAMGLIVLANEAGIIHVVDKQW